MDAATTESIAHRLSSRLKAERTFPRRAFAGHGIVICAGGPRMFTNAYVLIHVLRRHLGCRLPMEVWHFGPRELSPRMASLLRALDAQPVDACAVMSLQPPQLSNPWQLKPYAIMWSQFSDVLYLDADQVPVRDPAELFAWPQFLAKGAVFWPDIIDLSADNPIWQLCGLPPRRVISIESGQLLIDKARHWVGLDMALALNEEAHHLYKLIHGDKDTFLLGTMMSGEEFALVPGRPKTDVPWCLYQSDFAGDVLFQHRTGAKWSFKGPQQELPQFFHREACEAALDELRSKWNGRVFPSQSRSTHAHDAEERLLGQRCRLSRPGEAETMLQLLADGEVRTEGTTEPANWHCDDAAGVATLVLSLGFDPPLHFKLAQNGAWQAGDVMLFPADEHGQHNSINLVRELVAATGFPSPVSQLAWSKLQAALALLGRRQADLRGNVLALAEEQCPGPPREMLVELANSLSSADVLPPETVPSSDWNVILSRYTTRQPE